MSAITKRITIKGRVQGVGFRPFVYHLASSLSITGTVKNNMDGVTIIAQAKESTLQTFLTRLSTDKPNASRIEEIASKRIESEIDYKDFSIASSDDEGSSSLVVPVDLAVCKDCLQEMFDPLNRRYHYPFITCTQCGPRYSIIEALPYDRPRTSMNDFAMCERCASEYDDTNNRRHHAQPIACETCGPIVSLQQMDQTVIAEQQEAIHHAKRLLEDGKILAVKGIGGYHLVCDAANTEAVHTLRMRKNRPTRPLAVMVRSLETAHQLCTVNKVDEQLLTSSEAPIVVMPVHHWGVVRNVAPRYQSLGIMLPYTPLHHLLFDKAQFDALVVTSANVSGLPMIYREEDVFTHLQPICDAALIHNRPILHPIDDSVMYSEGERPFFIRRARGFAPEPISIEHNVNGILAYGGEQKNTFALGRHQQIFLSKHIGDIKGFEMRAHLQEEVAHTRKLLGIKEQHVIVDQHPNYATRQLVEEQPMFTAQHHHAHHVSCMADNGMNERCLSIILDGTGYGTDGHIWGFEVLYGDADSFIRLAHLTYTPLPGGEKAIQEPWRNAAAMMMTTFDSERTYVQKCFPDKTYECQIIKQMVQNKINSPLAGTCGRLFDAVSAILGICKVASYEGEAAILLSERIRGQENCTFTSYPYDLVETEDIVKIDFTSMLKAVTLDRLNGRSIDAIVGDFHETVAEAVVNALITAATKHAIYSKNVVLSGGSFHNTYLSRRIEEMLHFHHLNVYKHKRVPCNDGGLALGQIIIAKQAANAKE
ncbi:carbamoyltransferase HypF [Bacillus tianshenii]|nr:carbamoyltransferase HypF [Bacillus tianshenii]